MDGLTIILSISAPFTQEQWMSLSGEIHASRPNIDGHDELEASNVCLHCVPITLQRPQATNHNMCNMWIFFGAISLICNVMSNTKARIMCWWSCMSATWGLGCPSRICWLWRHISPIKTPFFAGNFLCQEHDGRGYIEQSTMLCEDGRSWMTGDWSQIIFATTFYEQMCSVIMIDNYKNIQMIVFRIQRCCTQLNTEHVQNLTSLNWCTTWKYMTHMLKIKSHGSILNWSCGVPIWIALNHRNPTSIGHTCSNCTPMWLNSIHIM